MPIRQSYTYLNLLRHPPILTTLQNIRTESLPHTLSPSHVRIYGLLNSPLNSCFCGKLVHFKATFCDAIAHSLDQITSLLVNLPISLEPAVSSSESWVANVTCLVILGAPIPNDDTCNSSGWVSWRSIHLTLRKMLSVQWSGTLMTFFWMVYTQSR